MKASRHNIALDLIRAVSALAVFLGHLRALYFLEYGSLETKSVFALVVYFLSGFGHQAVIVFFVLSGYLIVGSILDARRREAWSLTDYTLRRMTRLWTVLLPALVFTWVWDFLGGHIFPTAPVYQGDYDSVVAEPPVSQLTVGTFVGNALFLNTILVPCLGSNGPLWSLANEFWYYTLFPIFYLGVCGDMSRSLRVLVVFAGLFLLWFVGLSISLYFALWLLGGSVWWLTHPAGSRKPFHSRPIQIGAVFLVAIVLGFIRVNILQGFLSDFVLAVAIGVLIGAYANFRAPRSIISSVTQWFADISFTMYVVHLPVAVFLAAWLVPQRVPFTTKNFAGFLALMAVMLMYITLMWLCFEKNTRRIFEASRKLFFLHEVSRAKPD